MSFDTMAAADNTIAQVLEFDKDTDFTAPEIRNQVREALEAGNVLYLKGRGFEVTDRERAIITDPKIIFRGNEQRAKRNGRPTLTFDMAVNRLLFNRIQMPEKREIEAYIAAYAKGGEKVGSYTNQTKALTKAFELCPEG